MPRYNAVMDPTPPDARAVLDDAFLRMRERCLSLAADLDRIGRAAGGQSVLESDPRLLQLRQALGSLEEPGRAERVQMIFSDRSPRP